MTESTQEQVVQKRKPAPEAAVASTTTPKSRLEIEQAFDAKYPEFKHTWGPASLTVQEQREHGIVGLAKRDNAEVGFGADVLYQLSREEWKKVVGQQSDDSFQSVKRTARRPSDLQKTAKPVQPVTRAERFKKRDEM